MRTLSECLSEMESAIRRVEDCLAEARTIMADMERMSVDSVQDIEPLDIALDDAREPEEMSLIEEEAAPEVEPAVEIEQEVNRDTVIELVKEPLQDNSSSKSLIMDMPVTEQKSSLMDVSGKRDAWRTDRPGTPVKNILSAISLNDRLLFMNSLFRKDALLFQGVISRINNMNDFEEAEQYLLSMFPEWKYDSDAVYRFMMAVRRRFN